MTEVLVLLFRLIMWCHERRQHRGHRRVTFPGGWMCSCGAGQLSKLR